VILKTYRLKVAPTRQPSISDPGYGGWEGG